MRICDDCLVASQETTCWLCGREMRVARWQETGPQGRSMHHYVPTALTYRVGGEDQPIPDPEPASII